MSNHSNLKKNLRIGVIGAGPAGLAAAEALREKEFKNITVLEKTKRPGGMVLSLTFPKSDGSEIIYEMGSLQPVSSPIFYRLIKKYGLHVGKYIEANHSDALYLKLYSLNKHASIIDFTKHKLGFPIKQFPLLFLDMLKLTGFFIKYRKLNKPGFMVPSSYLEQLSIPCSQWIEQANFKILDTPLKMLDVTMTMGNTHVKEEVSMLLLFKLFFQVIKWPPQRLRYLNGLHKFMKEGYQELWKRVAKNHQIIYDAQIQSVKRKDNTVIVNLKDEALEFDKIIVTCSLTQASHFLDLTEQEKLLFPTVKYSPGWRVAFLAKGLPHDALYSFLEPYMQINGEPFLQGFYPEGQVDNDTWLYSAGISLPENIGLDPYLKKTEDFLRNEFNAEIIKWVNTAFWPEYVPHFLPKEVKEGVYQKLERLQGLNNTYYAGGTLSGHSNATVAEYSYYLIEKYFHK